VSDPGPFGDNPFQGLPFFGDLARMMQGQGPLSWDTARQFAFAVSTEGKPETNVDPAVRFRYQELGRIAELHVQHATGLETTVGGRAVEIVPVTPGVWAARSLDAYRPLFERLAGSLGRTTAVAEPGDETADDANALIGSMLAMLSPMMLGMAVGGMVGHLARQSFGQYDLPIPRPPSSELQIVASTVERFGNDWSLPLDDLQLWVCLQELTTHAVLGVPHVRAELERLVGEYVAGFRPDAAALGDKLASMDLGGGPDAIGEMQRMFGDPEVLLGAIRSPEQLALLPRLDALVAVVVGFVDHTLDAVADGLLSTAGRIAEAVRRRRVEAGQSDLFVERLLGLKLTQAQVERGAAFVAGVAERAGDAGLARLWHSVRELPTPAEIDAPGLWLARIDLPD
jgi:putative hydrolase